MNSIQETNLGRQTPSAQRAAQSSWMLVVLAFILVQLSRRVPGFLVPCEIASLVVAVSGVVCGIVALFGIKRHGTNRILWPSLLGIIANGLLLFIFVVNFTAVRAAAKSSSRRMIQMLPHLGTWDTKTPKGGSMSFTFTPDSFSMVLPNGRKLSGPYTIDYARNPVWLTIQPHDADGKQQAMPFIVEFLDHNRMRMLGPARGTNTRPADFGDSPDILVFNKRS